MIRNNDCNVFAKAQTHGTQEKASNGTAPGATAVSVCLCVLAKKAEKSNNY